MAKYEITGQYPKVRRDHAADAFYSAVYDEIKANAGLDTQWGHRAATEAAAISNTLYADGVPVGFKATVSVGPYRDDVTIERVA